MYYFFLSKVKLNTYHLNYYLKENFLLFNELTLIIQFYFRFLSSLPNRSFSIYISFKIPVPLIEQVLFFKNFKFLETITHLFYYIPQVKFTSILLYHRILYFHSQLLQYFFN